MNSHQRLLLEMLKDLDAVCRKHGISYQLFSGTALGAVRHQGFIPWDDDLDIVMLRNEYERFFDEASTDFDQKKYFVQREFTEHWPMQFSKLRRNGTACMEKYHPKDPKMHQGVYIDIFPCDNLSDFWLMRILQFLASKVVIAKALYARGYETDSHVKKIFIQACRPLPLKPFQRIVSGGRGNTKMVHTFFGAGSKYSKNVYDRTWFSESEERNFEDGGFPVSTHYDELLTKLYGNYLRLPEPEERKCKEHAAILDLEHPYTDYLERQRSMTIDTYTRTIR